MSGQTTRHGRSENAIITMHVVPRVLGKTGRPGPDYMGNRPGMAERKESSIATSSLVQQHVPCLVCLVPLSRAPDDL
jgi:hypothetical protein